MKYVKLIAKPDTWFKAGYEVFHYDADYFGKKRITLGEWEEAVKGGCGIGVRGIRVCEDTPNENGMGHVAGEEREDGEWCSLDEFEIEIVENQFGE